MIESEASLPGTLSPEHPYLNSKAFNYWPNALDVFADILENWKLLIAAPVVSGLIAFALVSIVPRPWASVAYIGPLDETVGKTAGSMLRTPRVLDGVLQKFPQYPNPSWDLNDRRKYLDRHVQWTSAREADTKHPSLYALAVEDYDPALAQALVSSVVDNWLSALRPPPDQKARLERLLDAERSEADDISLVIAELLKRPELLIPDIKSAYFPPNIADLIRLRFETVSKIEDLKVSLEGGSRDSIFTPATLAAPAGARRSVVAAITAGSALVLVIGWILLRRFLGILAGHPVYAPKIRRIGSAVRWRVGAV